MKCPKCKSSSAIYSVFSLGDEARLRYRRCVVCDYRWKTCETVYRGNEVKRRAIPEPVG